MESRVRIEKSKTKEVAPTDAEDAARQIPSLDETSKTGLGSEQESTSKDSSRDRIQPVILRWVSGAYIYHP